MVARNIAIPVQNALVPEIVRLAAPFIYVASQSPASHKRRGRDRRVGRSHYFAPDSQRSRCGKVTLQDLDPGLVAASPFEATCGLCRRFVASLRDPDDFRCYGFAP
jgi:hypothetical protein